MQVEVQETERARSFTAFRRWQIKFCNRDLCFLPEGLPSIYSILFTAVFLAFHKSLHSCARMRVSEFTR